MMTLTRVATLGRFLKATPILEEQLFTLPQFQLCWSALSTSEALGKLELMMPNLLLMADQLPDTTLPEACGVIRAWAPDLTIIVINSGPHQHYLQEMTEAQINHYVPFGELKTKLPDLITELCVMGPSFKAQYASRAYFRQ
ncbi:MAG: hypothetical protein ACOCZ8_04300, partial [Bacteroidota bacterium]